MSEDARVGPVTRSGLCSTHSNLSSRTVVATGSLVNLVKKADESVLGDALPHLTRLGHSDEQVGNLACLLRLDEADSRDYMVQKDRVSKES